MKVLISGISGFLGINLTRYLLDKNVKVSGLDIVEFNYPEKKKIDFVLGDIRNKNEIEKAISDVDMVVHCAAALPLYSDDDIYSTDFVGTRNMLEVSWKHNVKRFVEISSTAVYGIPDHHPLLENDKLIGVGKYGECKIKAEALCEKYREKGMIITTLRPKSFVGPERLGVFALLYDWAKSGKNFPVLGSGKNRYQLLDVEDLCEAIWLSLKLPKNKVNDTFNIAAKEFTTLGADYQAVLTEAGFGKKIVPIPAAPAIVTLRILEKFHLSPLYKWVYETVTQDSYVSIEKAERMLGFRPKHSNQQALIRNYKWYLANMNNFQGQSGVSHRVPWKQGVLGLAKLFF